MLHLRQGLQVQRQLLLQRGRYTRGVPRHGGWGDTTWRPTLLLLLLLLLLNLC
jgi:hypothetical protein